MSCAADQTPIPQSRRYRGPQGLGDEAARALAAGSRPGESLGAMAEELVLRRWAEENRKLIPLEDWSRYRLISNQTSEHEVRYCEADHRAVKRTWPGTFGFIPKPDANLRWMPSPATPGEYLVRMALQNEIFGDSIRLEGAMVVPGPAMIVGAPPEGLSLVISQPWLDAMDATQPHPTDAQVADYLKSRGFSPLAGSFFGWQVEDSGIIVLDAKCDNFITTADGILPIDLQITKLQRAA
jgi:hypothetical protein